MKTRKNEKTIAWLGLDAHAHFCVLAWMDDSGARRAHWRFPTKETELCQHLKSIPATTKHLALEECGPSRWLAQVARPHVTEVVVCDPRQNHLISRHHHKCDEEDSYTLARLHRSGDIKVIWQPTNDARAVFKCAVLAYLDAVQRQTALKLQLKAHYRQWGVIPTGSTIYGSGRNQWLAQVKEPGIRTQLQILHEQLDSALEGERKSRRLMVQLGRQFPEVKRLGSVTGVGPIGANIFAAFIQEPGRFETQQQLFHYCRLGIRDRSSDGKPLAWPRLDWQGHGVLKAISYRAWLSAIKRGRGAVYEFYRQSLERTHNELHARLNTQRKVLVTLWTLWRKEASFDPKLFFGSNPQPTAKATCG
jgi:transposase